MTIPDPRVTSYELKKIPVAQICAALEETAKRFLNPQSPWRHRAIFETAAQAGFTEPMIRQALDWTFSEMTAGRLLQLVVAELGSAGAPDDESMRSPSLVFLTAAGAIFQPAIYGIACALLVKSPILVKCSSHERQMIPLFVECLRDVTDDIGQAAQAGYWPGQDRDDLWAKADAFLAFGSDETISDIRARISVGTIFIGHGHKISVAVVGQGSLNSISDAQGTAKRLAIDIAMYDQSGCLSPQNVWIETGGRVGPGQFAGMLSEELAGLAGTLPPGPFGVGQAAAISAFRSEYEFRSAAGHGACRCFFGDRLSYTVIVDPDPSFCPSPLGRTILVKPIDRISEWAGCLTSIAGHVQGIGAAPMADFREVFRDCRNLGASYFCEIGRMQRPPITWQNGGIPCLRSLLKVS